MTDGLFVLARSKAGVRPSALEPVSRGPADEEVSALGRNALPSTEYWNTHSGMRSPNRTSVVAERARAPRQERSRRTRDALLDAAEALLAERPFHEIAVSAILERAGAGAASFYARFADKSELLHALHERFVARMLTTLEHLREVSAGARHGAAPSAADARRLARLLVEQLVLAHERDEGVLRAVAIEAFADERFAARALGVMLAMRAVACELMRPHRGRHSVKVWDERVGFGLRMVLATLDQLLFVPPAAKAQLAHENVDLAKRLTSALLRQLEL